MQTSDSSWAAAELRRYSDQPKQAEHPAHTPGPWRIGDSGYTVFGPPTENPSPKTIARLPKLALPCKMSAIDENIANARLIAAAPELLEAVKLALEWSEDGSSDTERSVIELQFREVARSAIARATGQS